MKSIIILVLLSFAATAFAQTSTLELMRKDLKTEKVAIITASIPLSEKQADAVLADLPGLRQRAEQTG